MYYSLCCYWLFWSTADYGSKTLPKVALSNEMTPNYLYYSHRLASFDSQTVTIAPAKGSRAAKNITFTWPHPPTFGATPQTLAAAGFYYAPEQGSEDRVVCFCCDVGLANWEKVDSPFEEHYTRNEDGCPWAAARCSLEKDRVKRGKSFM
jgi:hypothetical protein